MCGICGVVDWSDGPDADAIVRRMTPTMRHRGPDDEGYLESQQSRLALGMRRLSIIDVEGGHQPVFNEDGKVAAVLNGEIYNFLELRDELAALGHVFKTRSDSEVVAHAYEEWGPACVNRLQGMFAFAIYDRRMKTQQSAGESATPAGLPRRGPRGARGPSEEGVLFLGRDRLGIKPLYYASVSNQPSAVSKFIFASEVRTLLASGIVKRRLSRAALESFLMFGSVSEPMTLVEGVFSLPPGHTLSVDVGKQEPLKVKAYWNVGDRVNEISARRQNAGSRESGNGKSTNGHSEQGDNEATVARVRTLLEESVRSHLIADVPVGVFLSGGIDSTSLAGLASREVSGIHTFTVAFAEKEFDEAAIARRTAARFGTTHQEVRVTPDEMLSRVGDAVGALDQPSIDGVNTYFVSSSARNAGLKVTLSGLGGDEVFGGYSSFQRTPRYKQLAAAGAHVPGAFRAAMNTTMSAATSAVRASGGSRFVHRDATRKISALLNTPEALPDPFYFARTLFTPAQISGLMPGNNVLETSLWWQWLSASAEQARSLDSFAAVSCMEMQSYLVNTLLRDTDSMSMAHSLEVRVPFLDHSLVEFVTSLPKAMKVRKGVPKALLVTALSDLLPEEVVNQTKRGFTFPWAEWLRGPLKQKIENGLSELSPALAEVIDVGHVREVWLDYLGGKTSWSRPWSLYVLNEWVKTHLDCV
ncbi:MAG TPA: asparagine synthase (glutamine-hydrolyzing) [Pyrinomonadaceae bacterium]|nr:asparagine synthase (glutamine-hydrolyzing) [Pyrinomonadaceae bacterium]